MDMENGNETTGAKPLAYYLYATNTTELLAAAKDGTLTNVLRDEFYFYEADEIEAVRAAQALDDRDLLLTLTDLFPKLAEHLTDIEKAQLKDWIRRRRYIDSASESTHGTIPLVETQAEFVRALKSGAETIYLFEGEFELPLCKLDHPVYLCGIHNPVVNVRSSAPVNLADYSYTMANLTLFLQRPGLLVEPLPPYTEADELVILTDEAESTDGRAGLWRFQRLAEGRLPYASPATFAAHVEALPAIAIGTVTLWARDYDAVHPSFRVYPACLGRFLDFWEKGPAQRAWYLPASPEQAEALMAQQRKLRLFALFGVAVDGSLFIRALFLRTAGHDALYLTSTPLPEAEGKAAGAGAGTSACGGYGLDLIDDFDDDRGAASSIDELLANLA